MRTGIKAMMLVVAAALVAAAPAHAQRQSLADRVGALEQQLQNNQANTDMLNQLQQLRSEMQTLQGTIEQLQHENEQLKQRNRDQYLDLDGRLNRLEGGTDADGTAALPPPPAAKPAAAEKSPNVRGDAGAIAAAGDERAAYNVAFDALKAGRYDDSARLFQAFLEQHPEGVYAPNALYWLGESYYATRNFQLAQAQFSDLVARYPTHDKAAGGLLKLGLSQFGLGDAAQAERTLADVATRFPGSDAARTAQDRLQSIRLGQQIR
ncbi:tol-pal system protein YbgF [Stenotrophomonas mori]|uniref:Cell division coordinator CpoB n=1 Tax=Stenotrophomonas mori TaxID=2871096 RepID=A0ABT0SDG0_9GAMM|nr:tol-pal system protein YbgF [Stenotrophomonas mori]MCL7713363.1 tol-pal system protein YbgF [Stenotrophomonas mori]